MSAAERTARAMAEIEAARQGHRRINLRGANLSGANLRRANLTGARTSGVTWVGARFCKTMMPDLRVNDTHC